jgi:hypothetical protein
MLVRGVKGTVFRYVRPSGRCPAEEFLNGCIQEVVKKFEGSLDAATKIGAAYYIHERFKPLHGEGKPLWEFKHSQHRLYCERIELPGRCVRIVLLNGWIKDKAGKAKQEPREIKIAKTLLTEMQHVKKGATR